MQDKGRRLQTKTMTSQGSRVNKIVKVINHLCILNSCLDTRFVPALKLWMLHNCKDITNKRLEIKSRKKKKKEELTKNNWKDNTPRLGALYQWSNLGTSPQKSLESLPSIPRHKKVPRLLVREGWRKIHDDPRLPNLGHEFVVLIFLGLLQAVQVNELVQPNLVSLSDDHPNLHITKAMDLA